MKIVTGAAAHTYVPLFRIFRTLCARGWVLSGAWGAAESCARLRFRVYVISVGWDERGILGILLAEWVSDAGM